MADILVVMTQKYNMQTLNVSFFFLPTQTDIKTELCGVAMEHCIASAESLSNFTEKENTFKTDGIENMWSQKAEEIKHFLKLSRTATDLSI